MQFIESMRKEFYDATHNCFAWRFGPLGVEKRAADDGEPSGSAGKPILTALEKHDVLDAVVVVTRYFGGTKLGVGGLQRAYGDAAEHCLDEVERSAVHLTRAVRIDCSYEDISLLKRMMDGVVVSCEEEYDTAAHFVAQLPQSQAEDFANQVLAATHARAGVSVDD